MVSNRFPIDNVTTHPVHVDIVFVHGLTGNRYSTWTHRLEHEPWPKVILPKEILSCRVLTFGYDAYPGRLGHRTSHNMLRDHAQNFVHDLTALRQKDGSSYMPLILIGHSMGGLLLKAALRFAADKGPASDEYTIVNKTIGIFFMGTPHKGSWHADWAKIPAHVLGTIKTINMTLLEVLQEDNQYLLDLHGSFSMLRSRLRKEGHDIAVWCLYEELPMKSFTIVQPASARLEEGNDIGIHKDHSEMVKFRAGEGTLQKQPELRTLLEKMKAIIRDSVDDVAVKSALQVHPSLERSAPNTEAELLRDSLLFNGMYYQLSKIEDSDEDTCPWIYDHPNYISWHTVIPMSNQANEPFRRPLLIITGPLGSGKSTLLRSMVRHPSAFLAGAADLCIKFFFANNVEGLVGSVSGLWRAILYQLLKKFPDVARSNDPFEHQTSSETWDEKELWNFALSAIRNETLRGKQIILMVDAIDQGFDSKPSDLLSKFKRLSDVATSNLLDLRVCVSCRDANILLPSDWHTIDMDVCNQVDIKAILHTRIKSFLPQYPEADMLELERAVLEKTRGNILWLNIVLAHLQELYCRGRSPSFLLEDFKSINPTLEKMYGATTEKLGAPERHICSIMVSWLHTAKIPLTLQDLAFGVGLCLYNKTRPATYRSIQQFLRTSLADLPALQRFINYNSHGLLRVSFRRNEYLVKFTHDSVRSFFLRTKQGLGVLGFESLELFETASNNLIAQAFRTFCEMEEVQGSFTMNADHEEDFYQYLCESSMENLRGVQNPLLPLTRYFAQHALEHTSNSSWYIKRPAYAQPGLKIEMRQLLKGWLFSVCSTTDHLERSGYYDDAFWPHVVGPDSALKFFASNALHVGLDDDQLNDLVASINNRSIFLRNLAKDREEGTLFVAQAENREDGTHKVSEQHDEYVQIYYLSSRASKAIEFSDLVDSQLLDAEILSSSSKNAGSGFEANLQAFYYRCQKMCNSYAEGIAFVAHFKSDADFSVGDFRVANSAPIAQWRQQNCPASERIPRLTSWRIESNPLRLSKDSSLSLASDFTRAAVSY